MTTNCISSLTKSFLTSRGRKLRLFRIGFWLLTISLVGLLPVKVSFAATLTSIAVTPADPTNIVGQTQSFAGTGTFSDGSIQIISPSTALAAGGSHTCALLPDGTVQCWGYNGFGQLGNGSTTDSSVPLMVSGSYLMPVAKKIPLCMKTGTCLSVAPSIAAGLYHTCELLPDGTVQCWGANNGGQLGNNSTINSSVPVAVSGISTATAISAGTGHTCALLSDGTVQCWGANDGGQLGNGSTTNSSVPVAVSGISTATAISAGGASHTCALLSNGAVQCWGANGYGQLGNNSTINSSVPVTVSGISTATAIAAGYDHTCALLSNGTVQCWGWNSNGQLGNNSTAYSSVPVTVSGISTATAISAGYAHTCAVLSDGTVQCWGYNSYSQLGNNGTTDSSVPVTVSGISTATAISAGGAHTCALLSDGTEQCWGWNYNGQLGNNSTTDSSIPVTVISIATALSIGGYSYQTCAVLSNGTVECWGNNTRVSTPVMVSGLFTVRRAVPATVSAIANGDGFTCALLSDGTVQCWGYNGYGQLGNGTTTDSSTPVTASVSSYKAAAIAIAAGRAHACALLSDGTVQCWGFNGDGELGDTTTTGSSLPVTVSGISTATAIVAGDAHTCALLSDGTMQCWGSNLYGGLGNGAYPISSIPVTVSGITTATAISAGYEDTCALLSNGTVQCWGFNGEGELGNGSTTVSSVPVTVSGISTATAISAGGAHTCALLSDGTMQCWGLNDFGQLGIGTNSGPGTCGPLPCSTAPVSVSGISAATAISAGDAQTCALLSNGTVQCWGLNDSGELGMGIFPGPETCVGNGFSEPCSTTPRAVNNIPAPLVALATVWSSSNPAVATIDANGHATGSSPGTTTITATSGGLSGSTSLTVGSQNAGYTITASAGTGGSISPFGTVSANASGPTSFAITPDPGYQILSVIVDGANRGAITSYTFNNLTTVHTIAAYFTPLTNTITATAGAGGSISNPGVNTLYVGGSMTFAITPSAGYAISDVLVDGASQGTPTSSYQFTYGTGNHTISATFKANDPFIITASIGITGGGSMSPLGSVSVPGGANQTFTMTPAAGYRVDYVQVDGISVGALTSYTFHSVQAAHSISAFFTLDVYTVTAAADVNGVMSPWGISAFNPGVDVPYTITPNVGYQVSGVIVDGVQMGAITTYKFIKISANHTINAYFKAMPCTLMASVTTGGSISPAGTSTVNCGLNQTTYTITPTAGNTTTDVQVDGVSQGAMASYTFTNVTGNHTIGATFAAIPSYTITASSDSNGTISPAGSVSVQSGAYKKFTFTPNAGYRVADVLVGGVSVGARTSYTFNSVTSDSTISVSFTPDVYTITATADVNGSITPGTVTLNKGGSQTYTITPSGGYQVRSVIVDGANRGAITNYTFTNVTANHTINVYFK